MQFERWYCSKAKKKRLWKKARPAEVPKKHLQHAKCTRKWKGSNRRLKKQYTAAGQQGTRHKTMNLRQDEVAN